MNIKEQIAVIISNNLNMDLSFIESLIEIPSDSTNGDFSFPCYHLAKILKKSPATIASEICESINPDDKFESIKAVNAYVNFYLNKALFIEQTLNDVLKSGPLYASEISGKGKTILIEFSSPNIAKPFHIGHMYSTVIGNSLSKIYKHLGYNTVNINYLGDWGTQFGKLIAAYKKWGNDEVIWKNPIKELLKLYVKFHEEAEKNPDFEEEGRKYFKLLEEGDAEAERLWEQFKNLSLEEFNILYEKLGIKFDSYEGERYYSKKLAPTVTMLESKGLLEESNSAKVVYLQKFDLPPCLILKSDGTTIYAARDIAAAIHRKETYNFYKSIYVVGLPQELHFKQVFNVLKLAGYDWYKDCIHVGFGLVKFSDKKLSTRKGDVIFLEDLLGEAVNKVSSLIHEKSPQLSDRERIAEKVGIGAVIYSFLKNSREHDIIFTWEDTLNFNGESGPYVHYTYVRAKSILKKAPNAPHSVNPKYLTSETEFEIVKLLSQFKNSVIEAADRNEPFVILKNITDLSKAFNKYYNTQRILNAPEAQKNASLCLVKAVCIVIELGLSLCGIEVVENM